MPMSTVMAGPRCNVCAPVTCMRSPCAMCRPQRLEEQDDAVEAAELEAMARDPCLTEDPNIAASALSALTWACVMLIPDRGVRSSTNCYLWPWCLCLVCAVLTRARGCVCRRVRRDHWKGMSVAQRAAIVAQQAQQAAERRVALQVRAAMYIWACA